MIRNFYANLIGELDNRDNASLEECVDRAIERTVNKPTAYPDCPICHGTGTHIGGDEEVPCATCRVRARAEDRIRAAHEDSVEQQYRDAYGPDYAPLATWQAEDR